jgi:hypothetical protein
MRNGIQPGSPSVITGDAENDTSGALLLDSFIPAGDFTKIFFSLATNLSTFG